MADFKTHLTTSSLVGVVYGVVAHSEFHVPLTTSVISGCLCGLAGMLPDMDSDTGNAQREVMTFTAAVIPMLMIDRFAKLRLDHEQMVLATACTYIIVRFGFGEILRRYTVHRGMFHSIPAAIIAGLVTAIVCSCDVVAFKFAKVGAVTLGYVVHLVLDEMWSFEATRGRMRVKKSFGTAMKFFVKRPFPNVFTYGLLLLVGTLAYQDPSIMQYVQQRMAPQYVEGQQIDEHNHDHDYPFNLGLQGEANVTNGYR